MINLINKALNRFDLHLVKKDDSKKWSKIIYSRGYKNAILNSVGSGGIPEKDLPLVFDIEAPPEHYNYFVSCYMDGYEDGTQTINIIRKLLIKFI